MDDTINIRFKWTADECLTAYRLHWGHRVQPPVRLLLHLVAAVAMLAGGAMFYYHGVAAGPIVLVAAGAYWLFLRRSAVTLGIRRKFKKLPSRDKDIAYAVTPGHIRVAVEDLGESEHNWGAIKKVVHAPTGFLLYYSKAIFNWMPHSGFESESDIQKFAGLAKRKITAYEELA